MKFEAQPAYNRWSLIAYKNSNQSENTRSYLDFSAVTCICLFSRIRVIIFRFINSNCLIRIPIWEYSKSIIYNDMQFLLLLFFLFKRIILYSLDIKYIFLAYIALYISSIGCAYGNPYEWLIYNINIIFKQTVWFITDGFFQNEMWPDLY